MAWIKLATSDVPGYPLGNFWPAGSKGKAHLQAVLAYGLAPNQHIAIGMPDGQLGTGTLYRYELESWEHPGRWKRVLLGWLHAQRAHEPELLTERLAQTQGVKIV